MKKKVNESAWTIFSEYGNKYLDVYKNKVEYYHKVTPELLAQLDKVGTIDSGIASERYKGHIGKFIYIDNYGEPITLDELMSLKPMDSYSDGEQIPYEIYEHSESEFMTLVNDVFGDDPYLTSILFDDIMAIAMIRELNK